MVTENETTQTPAGDAESTSKKAAKKQAKEALKAAKVCIKNFTFEIKKKIILFMCL